MEALGHMNGLVDQLNGADTKSSFSKSYSMDKVFSVCHIPTITKSGETEDAADTMMYVVNFDNDEGYAVLAADSRMPADVLCITEKGHMSEELFAAAKEALEGDGATDDSLWVPMLLLASAERTRANGIDPGDPGLIGGGPGIMIGPFLRTKWCGDAAPFNSLTPSNNPAGCPVVAVAQIMAYEQHASTTVFNGVPCSWSAMKTVYTYPNTSYGGTENGRTQVANFFFELGKSNNCNILYQGTISYGTTEDACSTLRNYGYLNVTIHSNSNFTNGLKTFVDNQLLYAHPVYCRGRRADGGAHAWVIDGCYAGLYDFYHINWGFGGGESDGYFACGVFDTDLRDHTAYLDPGTSLSSPYNYTYDFKVITYSL